MVQFVKKPGFFGKAGLLLVGNVSADSVTPQGSRLSTERQPEILSEVDSQRAPGVSNYTDTIFDFGVAGELTMEFGRTFLKIPSFSTPRGSVPTGLLIPTSITLTAIPEPTTCGLV